LPKGKKIKVLTHRSRYIETVIVSKLGEGTSFGAAKAEQPAPTMPGEDPTKLTKVPEVGPAETTEQDAEAKEKAVKEPEPKLQKTLSPPTEADLLKVAKAPATTPKRRRMASVLDAVMETTRVLTPAPAKKVVEAAMTRAETEAGPSVPTRTEPAATEQRVEQESPDTVMALEKKDAPEKARSPIPEAPSEDPDFIIRHASGKKLSEEEIMEAKHYAWELKYSKGALVYNGMNEDDFLYCLPDSKEISVCQGNMGFPKLEVGLSARSKDDLADSLAYNSLKVQK
jgi:chemotaxis protein histidine kinase CheA